MLDQVRLERAPYRFRHRKGSQDRFFSMCLNNWFSFTCPPSGSISKSIQSNHLHSQTVLQWKAGSCYFPGSALTEEALQLSMGLNIRQEKCHCIAWLMSAWIFLCVQASPAQTGWMALSTEAGPGPGTWKERCLLTPLCWAGVPNGLLSNLPPLPKRM